MYIACSVQLARRVLQLERVNSALRKDTETERTHSQQLQDEVYILLCNTVHIPLYMYIYRYNIHT